MNELKSWNILHTVIYYATGKHPRCFLPIKSYPESRHTILAWWYNLYGYNYDKRNSSGINR